MSRLGLNIDLDDVARRLSFSGGSPPQLPPMPPRTTRHGRFTLTTIPEDPREQQPAATQAPAPPPPWVSSPFSAPHTATYERPAMSLPPVSPSQAPFSAPHTAPCARPLMSLPPVSPSQAPCARPLMSLPPVSPSPVHRQIVPVSPAPSGSPSQTPQRLAAALGKLEQNRQAGLQQAWIAAQQQQALALAFRGWEQGQGGSPQAWAVSQPQQAVEAALTELEQGRLPVPQLRLYTVEGEPAGYKTKWQELHPVSQQLLLQIEDKIREDRQACEQLDQCSRLDEPSAWNKSYERDARQITQEIGSISTIMDREKASIQSLTDAVKENIATLEFAIGSYLKLRPWFVSRGAPTDFGHHGSVRRPSIFMQNLVNRFEKQLEECCNLIGELEQLAQMKNNKIYPPSLESLPKVMSNMHDYFMYVASKVENFHQCAEKIRIHHLNGLRNSGRNDPFVEADRKEAAKQEAASRTVHPSLRTGDTGRRRQMCN